MSITAIIPAPSKRADVVASLRGLADRIEAGVYGDVRFACATIVVDNALTCFGWGRCNDLEIAGAFARSSVIAGAAFRDSDESDSDNVV
jgi:hypothetical protein